MFIRAKVSVGQATHVWKAGLDSRDVLCAVWGGLRCRIQLRDWFFQHPKGSHGYGQSTCRWAAELIHGKGFATKRPRPAESLRAAEMLAQSSRGRSPGVGRLICHCPSLNASEEQPGRLAQDGPRLLCAHCSCFPHTRTEGQPLPFYFLMSPAPRDTWQV